MTEVSRREAIVGLGAVAGLAACGREKSADLQRKLGVAVAGIGSVATRSVLPALKNSDYCRWLV